MLFCVLLFFVTYASGRAITAAASTGCLAIFMVISHMNDNKYHHNKQCQSNQYSRKIFKQECSHFCPPLFIFGYVTVPIPSLLRASSQSESLLDGPDSCTLSCGLCVYCTDLPELQHYTNLTLSEPLLSGNWIPCMVLQAYKLQILQQ